MARSGDDHIVIDGSYLEGGGQILRNAAAYSCLFGKTVKVIKIRHNRPKPGLAASHLEALKLIEEIAGGNVLEGGWVGSCEITIRPRTGIKSIANLEGRCQTAGSITLMTQASLFPALACGASSIRLTGGTDVDFSPPSGYMTQVFIPMVSKIFSLGYFDVKIPKRGFYPKGGGLLTIDFPKSDLNSSDSTPPDRNIFPLPAFSWPADVRIVLEGRDRNAACGLCSPVINIVEVCVSIGGLQATEDILKQYRIAPSVPGDHAQNSWLKDCLPANAKDVVQFGDTVNFRMDVDQSHTPEGCVCNILFKSCEGALYFGSSTAGGFAKKGKGRGKGAAQDSSEWSSKNNDIVQATLQKGVIDLRQRIDAVLVSSILGPTVRSFPPLTHVPTGEHLQDQLILPMAIAEGRSYLLTEPLSLHTRAAMHVAEKMTGCCFKTYRYDENGQIHQTRRDDPRICNLRDPGDKSNPIRKAGTVLYPVIITCDGAGFFCGRLAVTDTIGSGELTSEKVNAIHQELEKLEREFRSLDVCFTQGTSGQPNVLGTISVRGHTSSFPAGVTLEKLYLRIAQCLQYYSLNAL